MSTIQIKLPYQTIAIGYDFHGYLKQMTVKCMCFRDVTTKYVVILDSDIIFTMDYYFNLPTNENDKMTWNVLDKNKDNCNQQVWSVWGNSVKNMINKPMNRFYMQNGFPFIFKTETLKKAYIKFKEIHGVDYDSYCKTMLDKHQIICSDPITGSNGKFAILATIFEEFEYLGWFCENFTNDYIFSNQYHQKNIVYPVKQYWSHGGLTANIEKEIKQILLK